MFHLAAETLLFSALGDEFVFSTFMRACFDFLRQKNRGPSLYGPVKEILDLPFV